MKRSVPHNKPMYCKVSTSSDYFSSAKGSELLELLMDEKSRRQKRWLPLSHPKSCSSVLKWSSVNFNPRPLNRDLNSAPTTFEDETGGGRRLGRPRRPRPRTLNGFPPTRNFS